MATTTTTTIILIVMKSNLTRYRTVVEPNCNLIVNLEVRIMEILP